MAAVLGLRGSGSFGADNSLGRRPENWREGYLMLYPNGKAPLTAMLSMLKSEKTDDPRFHWYEKGLPGQVLAVNGTIGAGITTLVVDATAGNFVGAKACCAGTILKYEGTGEQLLVTADPTNDTTLTISREHGTTTADTIADYVPGSSAGVLTIIGNVYEEGGALPTAVGFDPTEKTNVCQIFRSSIYSTRTAMKTRLRTGNQVVQAKKEALEMLNIQRERAYIFSELKVDTGPKGQPRRKTQGLVPKITADASDNIISVGGALTESAWDTYLEQLFRYGSNGKVAFCGSTALLALATMAKKGGIQLTMASKDTTYGMDLLEYLTPFGKLYLKSHPLFNEHPLHRQNVLAVDPAFLHEKYVDDVNFYKDRGDRGDDATANEWLGETGPEFHHAKCHMYLTGITSFAP